MMLDIESFSDHGRGSETKAERMLGWILETVE